MENLINDDLDPSSSVMNLIINLTMDLIVDEDTRGDAMNPN